MKKLFLFTLICSLGFFTACSDDDDNDTPTPTPPEVNLAKEIEGLYNADLFLTYESAQDTSDQTINFFPQGKDYVKLKPVISITRLAKIRSVLLKSILFL